MSCSTARRSRAARILPLALLCAAASARGAAPQSPQTAGAPAQAWTSWLRLGPVALRAPAFESKAVPEARFGIEKLRPAASDVVIWPGAGELRWEALYVGSGKLVLGAPDSASAHDAETWLAGYLGVDRFTRLAVDLTGGADLALWLDGAPLVVESQGEGRRRAKLELTTGDHVVLLRSFRAKAPGAWELGASIRVESGDETPQITTQPEHRLALSDVIDTDEIEGLEVAPDGKHVAIRCVSPAVPAPHTTRWIEIRRTEDGALLRTTRGSGALGGFAWGPRGDRFAFTERKGEKTALWIEELSGGERRAVAEGLEHFAGLRWKPDGSGFVIALSTEAKPDERGVQRMRGLTDRWAGARDRSQLFELALDGTRRKLTGGELSCDLLDVSPDGRRVLFEREHRELPPRELANSEVCELALGDLSVKPLFRTAWFQGARYDPSGQRLLLIAGPSAFEGRGRSLPEGVLANDYDMQAYVMSLGSGEIEPITKGRDLSVEWGTWDEKGEHLVFRVTSGAFSKHVLYDVGAKSWRDLAATGDVAAQSSRGGSVLACVGSGAVEPPAVYVQSLPAALPAAEPAATGTTTARMLFRPAAASWKRVRLGSAETYEATLASGEKIDGFVLLPIDFDPSQRYPCIVNYYAGTSPVSREFAGRYPKSWWAAQGYVVYVLQPSGATGYGQAFSARHVNNWGRVTTPEIIEAVQRFLDAHPYVDRERVGCIGASYGGFSTLLLLTHTQLFAGAVSHAGISSLSSYWGEGWWGAPYSSVASANSFPWNARELYVEQSALFRADRIQTPLLLLHGTADTNVPVGESEQIYTALRLLGRDVEYLRVEGENHHVVSYLKRKLWMQSIVAWFDKTLKREPAWWQQLYDGRG